MRAIRARIAPSSPSSRPSLPHTSSCAPPELRPILNSVRARSTPEDSRGVPPLPGGAPPISREAILDRIARAKQYNQASEGAAAPTSAPPPGQQGSGAWPSDEAPPSSSSRPSSTAAEAAEAAPMGQSNTPSSSSDQIPLPFAQRPTDGMKDDEFIGMMRSMPLRPGAGGASEAADYLQGVFSRDNDPASGMDPNMRPEEFSVMKEERMRRMGAEIITVDQNYDAGGSTSPVLPPGVAGKAGEDVSYRPKVSTWGVFPRPNNISAAYGGGRTIIPGQELETKEQKEAREAEFRASMTAYRQKMGLDIDPELEVEAQVLVDEGMIEFKKGDLSMASEKFDKALALVPLRTKPGGIAALQKAIILDSRGYTDEAKKLYQQCRGHALTSVSRKAKQLLFGFQASTFLKADTISYATKNKDYENYFRKIADRNKVYIPTEEEKKQDADMAHVTSIIAISVIFGPLALFAALATNPSIVSGAL